MKNIITTTSQTVTNYINAADKIMNFITDLGFTADELKDPEMIRHTIAQIIRESIEEGNTIIDYDDCGELGIPRCGRTFDPGEYEEDCLCHDDEMERFLNEEELDEEITHKCQCPCGCNNRKKQNE